jgi:arylsulfatase A-like enzyme
VPGFANWPGRIKPRTVPVPDPVHVIDWFPTLVALTGATANADLDGIDFSPALFADESLPERELYWIWHPRTNRWALRHGNWSQQPWPPGNFD